MCVFFLSMLYVFLSKVGGLYYSPSHNIIGTISHKTLLRQCMGGGGEVLGVYPLGQSTYLMFLRVTMKVHVDDTRNPDLPSCS